MKQYATERLVSYELYYQGRGGGTSCIVFCVVDSMIDENFVTNTVSDYHYKSLALLCESVYRDFFNNPLKVQRIYCNDDSHRAVIDQLAFYNLTARPLENPCDL